MLNTPTYARVQGLKAAREFVVKHILPQDENLDLIPFLRQRLPRHTLSDLLTRRGSGAPYYVYVHGERSSHVWSGVAEDVNLTINIACGFFRVLQESARYSSKSTFVVGVYSDSQLLGQGSGQSIGKAETAVHLLLLLLTDRSSYWH